MTFLAPLSLLALLPWAALAIWAWRGRATRASVPFVRLWPTTPTPVGATQRRRPPWSVLLLLLAMLCAILAASNPRLDAFERWTTLRVTLVVDRGLTMAPNNRLANMLAHAQRLLHDVAGRVELDVVAVSHGPIDEPVALDTARRLDRVVAEQLQRGERLVVVVSDQNVLGDDTLISSSDPSTPKLRVRGFEPEPDSEAEPESEASASASEENTRFLQIAPTEPVANAAIVEVLASDEGARVVIRNDSFATGTPATLRIVTNQGESVQPLLLPAPGETMALVVPFADETDAATMTLEVTGDDWPFDNLFSVAQTRAWPRVEVVGDLPAEVERMANVFARLRPDRPWSRRVVITANELPADASGVQIAPATVSADRLRPTEAFGPLAGVAWDRLESPRVAREAPGGWRVVLETTDGRPAMAVRETNGIRQAWLGFAADGFAQEVAFVRFWADLLTWLNGGAPAWGWSVAGGAGVSPAEVAQGIERAADERPRARNLPRVPFRTTPERPDVAEVLAGQRVGLRLAPWLLAAGVGLSVLAAGWATHGVGWRRWWGPARAVGNRPEVGNSSGGAGA